MNLILLPIHGARHHIASQLASHIRQHGHKIFRAGQDKGIALVVGVLGQALVGLAANVIDGQRPAETKRAVARPGIVTKRQLGAKTGTASEPVPVTGLRLNFSAIARRAPPPLGRLNCGAATLNGCSCVFPAAGSGLASVSGLGCSATTPPCAYVVLHALEINSSAAPS